MSCFSEAGPICDHKGLTPIPGTDFYREGIRFGTSRVLLHSRFPQRNTRENEYKCRSAGIRTQVPRLLYWAVSGDDMTHYYYTPLNRVHDMVKITHERQNAT